MVTLTGALLAIWTAACIGIGIFLSILAFAGLVCTISPPDYPLPRLEAFSGFVCCTILAGLFFIHAFNLASKPQEIPATRDIHLTVPQESSVNAQVTSGNTTVHLKNL